MGRMTQTARRHNRGFRWLVAAAVAGWMFAGLAGVAGAAERGADEVSRITNEVTESIESPYCPGQTLAMCPSEAAAETRREIQDMARQGQDADEIKQELLDRYGSQYELHDPTTGDQMTLLGGIIGGLIVAIGAVSLLARRRLDDESDDDGSGDGSGGGSGPEPEVDDEVYLEELRAEYQD